jgi:ankyrin repeat protein
LPLHLAALTFNLEVARALVQAGARVGANDKSGKTPVQLARSNDNDEGCELQKKATVAYLMRLSLVRRTS